MKFLLIYGPPAVGKLTVAKEVARLTGMKLFDNHATVNAVAPVFGFEHDAYGRLLRLIRLAILDEAARAKVDLVSTYVYNQLRPLSEEYISQVEQLLAKYDAKVLLLRLTCDRIALDERVTNEDRRLKQSINTVEGLAGYMAERDPDHAIPGRDSLTIDNTHLSPTQVAESAIAHFGLETVAAASA